MNSDVMDCIITEQLPCSNLKGKRLVDYLQYSHSLMGCALCAQASPRAPCWAWIKCYSCHRLGHVIRHCVAFWK
jgi:hypothetical protein